MTNEQLSAWVDAEVSVAESSLLLKGLVQSPDLQKSCEMYWLIGDCLRAEIPVGHDLRAAVMASLVTEPTVLAPTQRKPHAELSRWMPIAAAVTGVAVAAWMGLGLWSSATPLIAPSQVAQQGLAAESLLASVEPEELALADDQRYLMAHQASALGAPIAGAAQYIRAVSADQAGDR